MTLATVININQQSIDRVLAAGLPVLLAFWRTASPIAAAQEATLDRLAQVYAGRAILARINTDEEPEVARRFRVSSTPVYVLTRNGRAELALASEDARNNVDGWLAHFVDGKPQPAVKVASSAPAGGSGQVLTLTDAAFQQTIDQPTPVLVDFWAPWCGPCRMVAPSVEKLAQTYAGRAIVGKLNVDENPVTSQRFQVMSIPTLLIFKDGQVVETIVGAQPYQAIQQRLARHV